MLFARRPTAASALACPRLRSAAGCGSLPTPGGLQRLLAAVDLPDCRVARSFHLAQPQCHSFSAVAPLLAAHALVGLATHQQHLADGADQRLQPGAGHGAGAKNTIVTALPLKLP